mmetsp:Transcript_2323/g.9845  ORF Transcript_2323/g.9845 Transcript_2323/m.9845 type:complete len:161 (-) Transcript_2323:766-1248(-)
MLFLLRSVAHRPESLGLISATMYLVCLCFLHLVHEQPVLYTAALSSVTLMTLLGFADDMLDLKWRYKLFLPLIACLPLLVNYTGSTSVMIPRPLRDYVGLNLVNIGYLYHLYMALMSIFCTNAINIYAGGHCLRKKSDRKKPTTLLNHATEPDRRLCQCH